MVIFGCGAIWLLGRREEWRRWGYVTGLISQPAWFFSGFYHNQWGLESVGLLFFDSCLSRIVIPYHARNLTIKPLRFPQMIERFRLCARVP
jgi:hypothetical protein